MRRLLLIAFHFPPEPAAGARRPGFLARYLPEFGWEATVLTRTRARAPDFACRVVSAPLAGETIERSLRETFDRPAGARASPLRRNLAAAKEALLFPDRCATWIPGALYRGFSVAHAGAFDAVLSTAMPASAHIVGAAISASTGLPWIADYRDPWSGNRYVSRGRVRDEVEGRFERWLVRRARALTTISQSIARQLERTHGRPAIAIENGIDPSDWSGLERVEPREFRFCYTGSMYDGKRDPEPLFAALAALRANREEAGDARVVFAGPNSGFVRDLAARYGLAERVEQRGVVSHAESLREQRAASDLLVFLNRDPQTQDELGSKILEYAGARRPILAFGSPRSAVRDFIGRHGLGWFAGDVDSACQAIRAAHRRYTAGDRELPPPTGALFTARDLAGAFARELDALVAQ